MSSQEIREGRYTNMLEYEVIWGHINILVVAFRSLSRSEQVKLY